MERAAIRTFRLDRVSSLEIAAASFVRLADFNPREYLAEHLPFVQSDYQIDLWIDMPLEDARRSFALWRASMEEQAGGTRVRCGRDDLDFFAAMLLSTRRRIVVHHPPQLRDTFRALALLSTEAAGVRRVSRYGIPEDKQSMPIRTA